MNNKQYYLDNFNYTTGTFNPDDNHNDKFDGNWKDSPPKVEEKKCFHSWKKYVGFTEIYYYCEHCDEKSNDDYDSAQKWYLK